MSREYLSCADFPNAPDCCYSCHDDCDNEIFDLCGFREGEVDVEVCCIVAGWIREDMGRIQSALDRKREADQEFLWIREAD